MKPSRAARFYDDYHRLSAQQDDEHPIRRRSHRLYLEWLRRLAPKPGGRLLDVSCGLGYFLKAAREYDPSLQLEGIDHSAFAVANASRRLPGVRLRVGDAMRLPYKSASFDTVTCLGSLEHYPSPEKGAAELARVLKPGGKALVYVPNQFFLGYIYLVWRTGETPHEAGQNEYERFETRQGWEALLTRQGLRVVEVRKHNEMFATERVPAWVKTLYGLFVEPFVPLNLSYCFAFYCVKEPRGRRR
jgi:ubiquinone/menaquinone biosynthesis C-methylase UbiE